MHIIIGIIVVIIILAALKELFLFLLPYILVLLAIVGIGALIVFLCKTFGTGAIVGIIIGIAALLIIIINIYHAIDRRKRARNKKQLTDHLEKNCTELGYMNDNDWKAQLDGFYDRPYPESESVSSIVNSFVKKCEKKYIPDTLDWILPVEELFKANEKVSMYQMIYVPEYEPLKYTHATPDEVLIKEQINRFLQLDSCKFKRDFIQTDDIEFRKQNNVRSTIVLTDNLKTIYTLKKQYKSFTNRPVIDLGDEDLSDFLNS